ncbi:MAG: nitrite reductase [Acidobacteria bacterium SCN 69-37]|nr:MAG: nitrite reductase [Acidobacteria bacterium SCN 69-37]
MAVQDDLKTVGRARSSFAKGTDIDEFATMLDKFERGEITPDQWRGFRLLRGTYGQRQDDVHMLRIKNPQGVVTVDQWRAMADVADRYSRGFGHITTRQNMQYHFVKVHDVEPAMRRLAEAGMTSREACGGAVRNITSSVFSGVALDEPFDVTPYSEIMTRYFLRHRLSGILPRKFKISFEGGPTDTIKVAINDIGLVGLIVDGRRGFRVFVGGSTSIMPVSGYRLYEFLPAEEMLEVAEAIVRVFHALGDFKNKHKNRLKFLIKKLGWETFVAEFEQRRAEIRAEGGVALPVDPATLPDEEAPSWPRPEAPSVADIATRVTAGEVRGPGIHPEPAPVFDVTDAQYAEWAATNVRPQKQSGYVTVIATVPLGDLSSEQMRVLADLSLAYGDGQTRVTPGQNVVFRWVRQEETRALYERLCAMGLPLGDADTIADVTSCPGAESCKLAVTQSRGLGRYVEEHIRANRRLIALAPSLDIKVSGCPNGCGQHHIAAVGFQGSLRKVDGRPAPQYFVMVGGGAGVEGATFGRLVAKIPARRGPQAAERLAELFAAERQDGESAAAFFNRVDLKAVKTLLADLEPLAPEDARPEDFIDLAEDHAFAPETSEGECAL